MHRARSGGRAGAGVRARWRTAGGPAGRARAQGRAPRAPPPHPTRSSVFPVNYQSCSRPCRRVVRAHQVSSGEQCYLLSKSRSCSDSCGPREMSFHDRSHRRSWLERFFMLAFLERMASKMSSRRKRRSCCCHGVCIGFLRPEAQSQEIEIEHEIMK